MSALLDRILYNIVANAPSAAAADLPTAYAHCFAIARAHYENFPTLAPFLSAAERKALAAIYTFARVADDIADRTDLPFAPSQRLQALDRLADALEHRTLLHPFLLAVYDTLEQFQIPAALLQRLLRAFQYDVHFQPFDTWQEVEWYCDHSANPIGEIVLAIARQHHPALLPLSNALCTALQLVNFWQDLAIDHQRQRCYIPLEVLHSVGASLPDLWNARLTQHQQHRILELLFNKTASYFRQTPPLVHHLSGRWALFLALILESGQRIFQKLQQAGPALFSQPRMVLRKRDFLRIFTAGVKRWVLRATAQ